MNVKLFVCLLFGHVPKRTSDKDMFGYEYVWQKTYCGRCGRRIKKAPDW